MKNSSMKSHSRSQRMFYDRRVKQKFCIKKDPHVYNNCMKLRSRAIKQRVQFNSVPLFILIPLRAISCVHISTTQKPDQSLTFLQNGSQQKI